MSCYLKLFSLFGIIISEEDFDPDDPDHCAVRRVYKPVTAVGRQPQSDVYVLGPKLHFRLDGTPIPPKRQEYLWLPHILQKLRVHFTPLDTLPVVGNRNALQHLVVSMGHIVGSNHFSGLFMLGKLCLAHLTLCCGNSLFCFPPQLPLTTPTSTHAHSPTCN